MSGDISKEQQHHEQDAEDTELNFSELIGNLLTSHEDDDDESNNHNNHNNHNNNEEHESDDIEGHVDEGDVDIPDLADDVEEPDFASVVANAMQTMEQLDASSTDNRDDTNKEISNNENGSSGMDDVQQSEWAHILQQGLLQTDHDNNDNTQTETLQDDALDQDDENLRRAILETLQGLNDDMGILNNNNNNNENIPSSKGHHISPFDELKQIEVIKKPTKKVPKKKKKEKQKQTTTANILGLTPKAHIGTRSIIPKIPTTKPSAASITESSKNTKDKQTKKKKHRKEKEKEKQKKAVETESSPNDHLVEIDDVIRGIMENDNLTSDDDDEENNVQYTNYTNNDNNDAETQALVEATLKAFEKELMASDATSKTTKQKNILKRPSHLITTTKTKPKIIRKPIKSTFDTVPTPPQLSSLLATKPISKHVDKDLDYEIPVSSFYPQPKKPTTVTSTSTAAKKKKKKKSTKTTASAGSNHSALTTTTATDYDFQEDEFSKVLADMVNQVVETSLSEPLSEQGKTNKLSKEKESSVMQDKDRKISQHMDDHISKVIHKNTNKDFDKQIDEHIEPQIGEHTTVNIGAHANEHITEDIDKHIDEHISKQLESQGETKLAKKTHTDNNKKKELIVVDHMMQNNLKIARRNKLKEIEKDKKKQMEESKMQKNFNPIIIDNYQKKLSASSTENKIIGLRQLRLQSKDKENNKNREIVIRNVEIENRFSKLKNNLTVKLQSPEELAKKKYTPIAIAAANEAKKRMREKEKECKLKLKEEKERLRTEKKAQKELEQAKFDAEQKELEEIVARGPPYPKDLRLTKKGTPKKPYRRWTPEEMALRARMKEYRDRDFDNDVTDGDKKKNRHGKISISSLRKSLLINFIKQNIDLQNNKDSKSIEDSLKKIGLTAEYFNNLTSESGKLDYSYDEIVQELSRKVDRKFDPTAKTIVRKENFLFHPPWSLPLNPPIALPMAKRSLTKKYQARERSLSQLQNNSAFMSLTRKLIPSVLNPIINTLKIAAKKRIANGASPEEATKHLLTIINHTKKSIAQVITNVRQRQLKDPLSKIKLESENNGLHQTPSESLLQTHITSDQRSNINSAPNDTSLKQIPIFNSINTRKRSQYLDLDAEKTVASTDPESKKNVLPLIPLIKRQKTELPHRHDFIVIDADNESDEGVVNKPRSVICNIDAGTSTKEITDSSKNSENSQSGNDSKVPLSPSVTDIGMATMLNDATQKDQNNNNSEQNQETGIKKTDTENLIVSNEEGKMEEKNIILTDDKSKPGEHNLVHIPLIDRNLSEGSDDNEGISHTKNVLGIINKERYDNTNDKQKEIDLNESSGLGNNIIQSSISTNEITKYDNIQNSVETETKYSSLDEESNDPHSVQSNTFATENDFSTVTGAKSSKDDSDIVNISKEETTDRLETSKLNANTNDDIVQVKLENNIDLKKIPISPPSNISSNNISTVNPVKVESMVKSLVVQQFQNSNEDDDQAFPDGITNMITSTLTDLIPEIQKNFILEERKKNKHDLNQVLNLDDVVIPPRRSITPLEKLTQIQTERKAKTPRAKERKDEFQIVYNFDIPDFSNITGKKNIMQKKLKEELDLELLMTLRKEMSKERKRRWRDANAVQNKINDLRSRVKRRANKMFGVGDTEEKTEWINLNFKRRCEISGLTEDMVPKPDPNDKRDNARLSDIEILNLLAVNLNRLDLARKIERSLIEEIDGNIEPQIKKRKTTKDLVTLSITNTPTTTPLISDDTSSHLSPSVSQSTTSQ